MSPGPLPPPKKKKTSHPTTTAKPSSSPVVNQEGRFKRAKRKRSAESPAMGTCEADTVDHGKPSAPSTPSNTLSNEENERDLEVAVGILAIIVQDFLEMDI